MQSRGSFTILSLNGEKTRNWRKHVKRRWVWSSMFLMDTIQKIGIFILSLEPLNATETLIYFSTFRTTECRNWAKCKSDAFVKQSGNFAQSTRFYSRWWLFFALWIGMSVEEHENRYNRIGLFAGFFFTVVWKGHKIFKMNDNYFKFLRVTHNKKYFSCFFNSIFLYFSEIDCSWSFNRRLYG